VLLAYFMHMSRSSKVSVETAHFSMGKAKATRPVARRTNALRCMFDFGDGALQGCCGADYD